MSARADLMAHLRRRDLETEADLMSAKRQVEGATEDAKRLTDELREIRALIAELSLGPL